ncbi:MAG: glycoside hydrolase family 127 protein [Clostridia bacterium]|nr:glycoside hydrolase family 127 protein [Clostridia bacterium]
MSKMNQKTKAVSMDHIDLTTGFWAEKQKLVHDVSMWNVYKRFAETGRFEAFKFNWREGMPNRPHIFWDSDVAKWMEAVAYYCEKQREPEMEKIVDDVVDEIEKNRMKDGYFNSYFGLLEPENRFTRRNDHELYCAGHLLEAAIAYKHATGKDKFFRLMVDYIDLIYQVFYVDKSAKFTSPGHEELELALVKLYRETGDKRYLDLSLYFVEQRGTVKYPDGTIQGAEIQDHLPIRQQKTAEGHAVRACYFYSAVADLAKETGDETLFDAARTLFDNIIERRMYVTGAIGQTCVRETFMDDYDLPNQTAYAETCANLSLALFARRMSVLDPDSKYADTAERVLYNSFISGMSLDGKGFFYSNMQENDLQVRRRKYDGRHTIFRPDDQRVEVFGCSCCPPNVVRTVASIADFQYTTDGDTVWMHQYFSSEAVIDGKKITVETGYPYDGAVRITCGGEAGTLALRIPGWCDSYSLMKNGSAVTAEAVKGYIYMTVTDGDILELNLSMPVRFAEANPHVWDDAGRIAVTRGPLVFCLEAVDQPELCLRDIRLSEDAEYRMTTDPMLGVPVLETTGFVRAWDDTILYGRPAKTLTPCPVRLIPYFAFANRGETAMIIWTMQA